VNKTLGPYQINTIVTGNAIQLTKQLPSDSVDAIVSDPPFKLSQTYTKNVDADNLLAVSSIWPVSVQWFRVAKPGAYAAIYYDTRILPLVINAMGEAGFTYLRGLTFYRRWGNANKLYGWMSTSDFILLFRKPADEPMKFYSDDWRHDVYTKTGAEDNGLNHVAQKPLNDLRHLVAHLCPAGGVVLDTYSGSGTTLAAAKVEGRNFLGFEINPHNVEIATGRMKALPVPMFTQPSNKHLQGTPQARLFPTSPDGS